MRAHPRVELDGFLDIVEQELIAKGLLDEIEGAGLHGLDRHGNIRVPGNDDDGNLKTQLLEPRLQLQSAHAGHAHVENEASRLLRIVLG